MTVPTAPVPSFLLRDAVAPSRDGVALSRDEVAPSRDGVALSHDEVTPSRDQVTLSRDQVAPSRDGVTLSSDQVVLSNLPEVRLRIHGVLLETRSGFVEIPEASREFIADPAREPSL